MPVAGPTAEIGPSVDFSLQKSLLPQKNKANRNSFVFENLQKAHTDGREITNKALVLNELQAETGNH